MEAKTIKISHGNYEWLSRYAANIQNKKGRPVSFDEALSDLKYNKDKKSSIIEIAGTWKMNDEEANRIIKDIYRERKITSRRL